MNLLEQPHFSNHLQTLAARWEQALDATGYSAAVVAAGINQNYFLDDQAPAYRPNPHFAQWFPSSATEHCELLLRPGSDPLLLFYQPADYWHLPPSVPGWAGSLFDIESHASLEELAKSRNNHLSGAGNTSGANSVAWIGPQDPTRASQGGPAMTYNPSELIAHLDFLRDQKTEFEIAAMREATARAVAGHLKARSAFFAGASEYEIYMEFLRATGNTEGQLPYSSIVALNDHGGVLHYQHYEQAAPAAHLSFLIDAGASHLGYASDITRTYSSAGGSITGSSESAPDEFAALIEALDKCQLELIDSIRTRSSYADLHGQMIDRIAALLVDHQVLTCTTDEAVAGRHADPFMPHGLGHLIGLQTHDVGGQIASTAGDAAPPDERFPALRLTRSMRANSVFTIEPGIYFIPMLLDELRATKAPINWPLIDRLLPCGGIRIEDNVWLTESGPVNLTREAFDAA